MCVSLISHHIDTSDTRLLWQIQNKMFYRKVINRILLTLLAAIILQSEIAICDVHLYGSDPEYFDTHLAHEWQFRTSFRRKFRDSERNRNRSFFLVFQATQYSNMNCSTTMSRKIRPKITLSIPTTNTVRPFCLRLDMSYWIALRYVRNSTPSFDFVQWFHIT